MENQVSVLLLTWNGERYLREVLTRLKRQSIKPVEIIAVDSGSTDSTLDILLDEQIAFRQIPHHLFSHSATRNYAVSLAKGEYAVFLTQDATPASDTWLENLLMPFHNARIAAVYSRQIPREMSDLLEARDITFYFGTKSRTVKMPDNVTDFRKKVLRYIQFSNVSAAYRTSLLREWPFDETLKMAEDQEWAKRCLEKGFEVHYSADSTVYHSHDLNLREKSMRQYDFGLAFGQFLSPLLGKRHFPLMQWMYHVLSDAVFISLCRTDTRTKFKALLRSPVERAIMHLNYYRGWNSAAVSDAQ